MTAAVDSPSAGRQQLPARPPGEASGTSGPAPPPLVEPPVLPGGAADSVGPGTAVGELGGAIRPPGSGPASTGAGRGGGRRVRWSSAPPAVGARGGTGTGKPSPEAGTRTWPVTQTGVWSLDAE